MNTTKPTAERVAKWDNVKLFLIICVVVGHMLNRQSKNSHSARELCWMIYQFHMPAFVLVSGLFSRKAVRGKRYDRAFSFLLLYFLTKFLGFAGNCFLGGKLQVSFFTELSVGWYALGMFAWYLATMFLQRFDRKYLLVFSVLLACIAGYDKDIGDFLALSRVLAFYPYFLAGFCLDPDRLLQLTRRRSVKLLSAAALAVLVVTALSKTDDLYWTMELVRNRYCYKKLAHLSEYGGLLRLLMYAVSGVLSFSVIALIPERRFGWSVLGQRTLSVYALHMLCLEIFFRGLHGHRFLRSVWPEHYRLLLVGVALLLVAVLSLKPVHTLVCRMITPGKAKEYE